MQPRRTITPVQLTVLMIVLIFGPIACGLLLWRSTNPMPEPPLPAWVRLDSIWVTPGGKRSDRRLIPAILVKNPTNEAWKNLTIGINEQFYASEPKGVSGGDTVSIPLEAFVSRNGSVRFPVGNRDIKLITLFAQLPSGARGVSEYPVPSDFFTRPKSPDENSNWLKHE